MVGAKIQDVLVDRYGMGQHVYVKKVTISMELYA